MATSKITSNKAAFLYISLVFVTIFLCCDNVDKHYISFIHSLYFIQMTMGDDDHHLSSGSMRFGYFKRHPKVFVFNFNKKVLLV